jgi:hypothetical protein
MFPGPVQALPRSRRFLLRSDKSLLAENCQGLPLGCFFAAHETGRRLHADGPFEPTAESGPVPKAHLKIGTLPYTATKKKGRRSGPSSISVASKKSGGKAAADNLM